MLPSAPPLASHTPRTRPGTASAALSTGPHQVLWGPMHPEEAHQQGGRQQLLHKEG